MGQIKNIKLHIVTDIKDRTMIHYIHLLAVLLLTYGITHFKVDSFSCYECDSEWSWENCTTDATRRCLGDQTLCGRIYLKQGNVRSFYRKCLTQTFCNDNEQDKAMCKHPDNDPPINLDHCEVKCCDTEY